MQWLWDRKVSRAVRGVLHGCGGGSSVCQACVVARMFEFNGFGRCFGGFLRWGLRAPRGPNVHLNISKNN